MSLRIHIAAASDRGQVRKQNQDFYAHQIPHQGCRHPKGILLAVADGMGGHAGGQEASRLAVDTLMRTYYSRPEALIQESLERAVLEANTAVLARAAEEPVLHGMGTTLTALVLQENVACYAHVGDTRGYLIQAGEIIQFTQDHSLVADLVRAGIVMPQDAGKHPDRNIITKAVGVHPALDVEIAILPEGLRAGQFYLLCCDGLHGQVTAEEINSVLQGEDDLKAACRRLVDLANARGGPDNITVLVAEVEESRR
jgi:serine/threonine protein phosphatase PrpC